MPRDTFRDPLILDTIDLKDSFLEKDLEAAILRDMQAFLMEVGRGFTFVASQNGIHPRAHSPAGTPLVAASGVPAT